MKTFLVFVLFVSAMLISVDAQAFHGHRPFPGVGQPIVRQRIVVPHHVVPIRNDFRFHHFNQRLIFPTPVVLPPPPAYYAPPQAYYAPAPQAIYSSQSYTTPVPQTYTAPSSATIIITNP